MTFLVARPGFPRRGGEGMRLSFADLWFDADRPARGEALRGYLGKTLRGAFGFALRRTTCHDPDASCDGCILCQHCAYAVVFEGVPAAGRQVMRKYPRVPQPFVLLLAGGTGTCSRPDGRLRFGIRLIGRACHSYPYVIQAARSMCERGLGRQREVFVLSRVTDGQNTIYEPTTPVLRPPSVRWLDLDAVGQPAARRIHLTLRTPVCLCADGRRAVLPSLEDVLRAAVRRTRLLATFYGEGDVPAVPKAVLAAARTSRAIWRQVRWHDVPRYSQRQGQGMLLRGVTGSAVFDWPAPDVSPEPWLEAARTFHVGKAVTFGFGGIEYRTE